MANLDISNIPDGADGLRIVRDWVQSVCRESDCYSGPVDRFRQWFIVAGTLAFDLDREHARSSITRTSLYKLTCEKYPIVQDFVAFLTAEARRSLTCGSLYLRCVREGMWGRMSSLLTCPLSDVLRNGLRVDLNAFCDLAERLSGLFIMAYRVNSRGVLHDITLPRSWFVNLIPLATDLRKDMSSLVAFASTIIELMQRIDAQVERDPTLASDTEEKFFADGDRTIDFMGPLYVARM